MDKFSNIAAKIRNPKFSSGAICAVTVAIILVANMILYILGTTFGWYLYSPEEYDLSLASESVAGELNRAESGVENGVNQPVKIWFCMTREDLAQHKKGALVLKTAEELQKAYPKLIELDFINIITRRDKDGNVVELDKYKENPDGTKNTILKTSVIFKHDDEFRVINDTQSTDGYATFYTIDSTMTPTSYNGEEILSSMVLWMLRDNHPTAYFTTGHGESSSSSLTTSFACAGYNLKTINLREEGGVPIDNAHNVLVISNPISDFEKGAEGILSELEAIEAFLKKGGHIYVAIDPYVEAKQLSNLTGFLEKYGIKISSTVNENGVTLRNIVKDSGNAVTTDGYTVVAGFADNKSASDVKGRVTAYGTGKVLVREAAALECSGNAYPVLITSSSSVCEVGGKVTDDSGGFTVAAAASVSGTGVSAGTIFVASTAYLTTDDVMVAKGYSNKDFLYAVADEIFYAETPPYGCGGIRMNTEMLEGLTMGTARIYTVIACLIPAAIAICGAVIIIRRKNR